MITIPRSMLKRLRIVFGRALGVTARSAAPAVTFRPQEAGGACISVVGEQAVISCQHPAESTFPPFAVPWEMLRRCEGTRDEPVTLRREDDEVIAAWTDAGIPQSTRFPVEEAEELPSVPETTQENGPELLTALRDAVQTADREPTRYALSCLRLRGRDGQIAATDGRQLLVQDGFTFDWDDEPLVPACRVFAGSDLHTSDVVHIGRTDEWITVHSGPWTIQLRIETACRFPQVDDRLPQSNHAPTTLRLSDADARFLTRTLRRLPAGGEFNAPVTVDLNGSVAVRARAADQATPTELILTGSRRDGDTVRFHTNRDFLARAARLGFRHVEVFGPEAPVCCRDGNRTYVWALLGRDGVIGSDPEATRIESPTASAATTSPEHEPRKPRTNRIASHIPRSADKEDDRDPQCVGELLDAAEKLRTSLRESLTQTTSLITGLKRHRRQSKRLRSAVLSLKQLQAIDA